MRKENPIILQNRRGEQRKKKDMETHKSQSDGAGRSQHLSAGDEKKAKNIEEGK